MIKAFNVSVHLTHQHSVKGQQLHGPAQTYAEILILFRRNYLEKFKRTLRHGFTGSLPEKRDKSVAPVVLPLILPSMHQQGRRSGDMQLSEFVKEINNQIRVPFSPLTLPFN